VLISVYSRNPHRRNRSRLGFSRPVRGSHGGYAIRTRHTRAADRERKWINYLCEQIPLAKAGSEHGALHRNNILSCSK
jgi:hypothetical protein